MRTRRCFLRPLLVLGVLGLFALAGCRTAPGIPSNVYGHPLPALIAERLTLVREVAWAKSHNGAPLFDAAREAGLKSRFVEEASARGLDPRRAEAFIVAQLDASRALQAYLLRSWENPAARPAHPPRDLASDLRPALDALTPRLLAALAADPRPNLAYAVEWLLRGEAIPPDVIALATTPLR